MKNFCIIPIAPRTVSTYLALLIYRHMDKHSTILGEFFNDRYNDSILTKKQIRNKINYISHLQQYYVIKIFPLNIKKHKEYLFNFILHNNMKLIFLEREHILEICVSAIFALNTNLFHTYDSINNKINSDIIFSESTLHWIFNNIKYYNKIKNIFDEKEYITIQHNELFNDEKILNKLGLDKQVNNYIKLPTRLYQQYTLEEKINLIKNKDYFLRCYNNEMKILKKELL